VALANQKALVTIHDTSSGYGYFEFDSPVYYLFSKRNGVQNPGVATILRRGPANLSATVQVSSVDSSAASSLAFAGFTLQGVPTYNSCDFAPVSQQITFAPGEVFKTVPLVSMGSGNEGFFRLLLTPMGGGGTGAIDEAAVNLVNTQSAPYVKLTSSLVAVEEKDGVASVTVVADGMQEKQQISVTYEVIDDTAQLGTDYSLPIADGVAATPGTASDFPGVVATGTLTFTGTNAASTNINFPILLRKDNQGKRSFSVRLVDPKLNQLDISGNPVGELSLVPELVLQQAEVRIYDTSNPHGVIEFLQPQYAVRSGGSVDVTIDRVSGNQGTATVFLSLVPGTATAGVDYDNSVSTVPVTFYNGVSSQKVTISTKPHALSTSVNFYLVLSPSTAMDGATVSKVYNSTKIVIQK
jgi:hypothetical protein